MCILIFMFFFFKQKTAYEMRISDWSSDVCSSDLVAARPLFGLKWTSRSCSDATRIVRRNVGSFTRLRRVREPKALPRSLANVPGPLVRADKGQSCTARLVDIPIIRSEERRVGKECVGTCKSGWSPYYEKITHEHKKQKKR